MDIMTVIATRTQLLLLLFIATASVTATAAVTVTATAAVIVTADVTAVVTATCF